MPARGGPRWVTALRRRVGRRGCYLAFLALLDGVVAYSLTFPEVRVVPLYRYAASVMPLAGWAAVWAGVGAVCGAQAFARRDQIGFGLAACLKAAWGALNLLAWLDGGVPRGWVGAMIWAAFAAITVVVSTWPEAWPLIEAANRAEER